MTLSELTRILTLARASAVDEMELVYPGVRLQFRRAPAYVPVAPVFPPTSASASIVPPGTPYDDALRLAAVHERGGLHLVRSASIGVFSSIDDTGASLLERGARVEAGAPIGTVTALGLGGKISAPVTGIVAAVYAQHGQPLQYGHLIAAIEI
jgi:biotin carboxyl carrier protein